MRMPVQIAIDGPVASGKSTVARELAQRLGFAFLDTGALYRAVAYLALQRGLSPDDEAQVAALLAASPPAVVGDPSDPVAYRVRVDNRLLESELFRPEVSQAVSPIAAMAQVRRGLIGAQRAFARNRDVVMAGRDIGTIVLPDAAYKFFLTASVDARTNRRWLELKQSGIEMNPQELRDEIVARDLRDTTRAVSPLRKAADALELDTSRMTVDEVVDALEKAVTARPR
jgi:cytidylate kinase